MRVREIAREKERESMCESTHTPNTFTQIQSVPDDHKCIIHSTHTHTPHILSGSQSLSLSVSLRPSKTLSLSVARARALSLSFSLSLSLSLCSSLPHPHPTLSGKVKFFNAAKKFGFITLPDGREAYVHASKVANPHVRASKGGANSPKNSRRALRAGDRVSLKVTSNHKGLVANDVELLQEAPGSPALCFEVPPCLMLCLRCPYA